MTTFNTLKHLYDESLYSNLVTAMHFLMPCIEAGKMGFNPQQEFHSYVYYGNSLYHMKDYRRAESAYQKAMDVKKNLTKNRKKTGTNLNNESDIELKYQLHLCYLKLQEISRALTLLETIPPKNRSIRIHMALGELYEKTKINSNAILCYKEVLKEHPLSMKVISSLIKLGVKSNEITNLVFNNLPLQGVDWIPFWIKAKASLNTADVGQGISIIKQLLSRPNLKDNTELLINLGEAYYLNGDYHKAIIEFKKAYSSDPLLIEKMDMFAFCLYKEDQMKELENLANKTFPRCDTGEKLSEPWIVLAYYCILNNNQTNKKESKALYFAQKACILSNNSIESLILKGIVLMETKTRTEAIACFSEAYQLAPQRFEALRYLAEAYLADGKKQQAIAMANEAFKHLGQNPRTLTLFAQMILPDSEKSSNKKNARISLEKAVRLDNSCLPAVYLLTNIYMEEKIFEKAIEMLTKAMEFSNCNKLHRLLGDCYKELKDDDKALHHHNIASELEVNYRSGTEASQRLEEQTLNSDQTSSTRVVVSSYADVVEAEEVPESENEVEEGEDLVWSDADF